MSRPKREGRILSTGVVRAQDVAATLGLGRDPGPAGRPPLSPADQRRVEEGKKPIGVPEDCEFEVTVLSEADRWDLFGRPTLAPDPNAPDGSPVPLEPRRDYEPARNQTPPEPTRLEQAAEYRRQAKAIDRQVNAEAERKIEVAVDAVRLGSPEVKRAAEADVQAAMKQVSAARTLKKNTEAEMTDLKRAEQSLQLDHMDAKIAEMEGKAVTKVQRLAIVELRANQLEARIALAEATGGVEGKVLSGARS